MLTPRHQALLMTLAGMTVGVAVFGTVLAINGNLSRNDTPAGIVNGHPAPSTPAHTDALQAAGVNTHYYISPQTGHEWQSWRRSLHEFAALLFLD